MSPNWSNRTLFHHDNLAVLRGMNSESVDLIATDPPFNKSKDFHATPDSLAAGGSFQDRWSWEKDVHQDWVDQITDDYPRLMEASESARYAHSDGMGAFMCFMAVRLLEMRRVLKPTGSIYLHCDPTASHYLKAVMDAIFGHDNFQNEIIWKRYNRPKGSQHKSRRYGRSSDTILFYSMGRNHTFNADEIQIPLSQSEIENRFSSADARGRFMSGPLIRSPSMGDRPNLVFEFQGYAPGPFGWRMGREKLQEIYDRGDFYFTSNGIPRRKFRPGEMPGEIVDNVWVDIGALESQDQERLGFPTQKPINLYGRIIRASSKNKGIVLDPFAGCATTLVAAEREGRHWVGIDIWGKVHEVVLERLKQEGLAADGDSADRLAFGDIHYTTKPPIRTDDGGSAAPFLRPKVKVFEPTGPKMSRAAMYRHLLDQNGPKCQGCDRVFDDPRYLDLDHNTPRSDGGINHISNRILLCGPCNRLKSNTLTLFGLQRENKKLGYMADSEGEHPLMREIREERENAPPTLFD